MTIETVSRRAGPFTGDGSTTNFPFEFKVFSESQISVQSAEGDEAETTLTLGEDYSVTLNSDQDENPGGTVTLASALATDTRLSIISAIPSTQLVKVTNYDRFYPTTFNDEFDKLTGLIQQLEERADRAVTVDSTDTMTPAELKEKLVTAADTATVVAKGYAEQAKASATAAAASETKTAEYATAAITIAPISEEVKTVAGAIDSVKTVSTNVASVKTVANNATTVKTVGDNITTVTTAAGLVPYASDLRAISPHTDDLHAVGQNISAVTTTSANISSVTTVASNVASVKNVANNATTVKTVGDNIEAVKSATAILPYAADLTTISPHVDDLHAVGQDLLSASGGITPVATHLEDCIHPVAQKLSDIHAVGVIADKVTAVANAATAIDAINTNIDAVKFAGENIDSITSAAQIIDAHKADPSGHPVATQSSAGFMSAADKTALDGAKVRVFKSVAELKAAASLSAGLAATTLGYYQQGDGGAAAYTVRAKTASDKDDGGSTLFLQNSLVAELIVKDSVSAKWFGAKGDGATDDTATIQAALSAYPVVVLPAGTYLLSNTLKIADGKTLQGCGASTVLKSGSADVAINVAGSKVDLISFSLTPATSGGTNVGININSTRGLTSATGAQNYKNINVKNLTVEYFSESQLALNNCWHVNVDNCVFHGLGASNSVQSKGVSFDYDGLKLSSWASSGCVFSNSYISSCYIGLNLYADWDTLAYNCIFEYNDTPIKKSLGSEARIVSCWFEENTNAVYAGGRLVFVGGRGVTYDDSTSTSNVDFLTTVGVYTQTRAGNVVTQFGDNDAVISGAVSNIKTSSATSVVALKAYSAYWTCKIGNETQLTGVLALTADGNSGGAGKSYSSLVFSSGRTNGSDTHEREVRPVAKIDEYGSITPEDSTASANLGALNKKYNVCYVKSIVLAGADGNNYKVTVNSSGTLTTTKM